MKNCEDCRWYKKENRCLHPENVYVDKLSGRKQEYTTASTLRRAIVSGCGYTAKWFEEKE